MWYFNNQIRVEQEFNRTELIFGHHEANSLNCFSDPQFRPVGTRLLRIICSPIRRGQWNYLPSIWTDFLHNIKATKNGYMEKWCVFFRRWSRNLETDPRKMPFKSAWKLSVVQAKVADEIFSRVFKIDYLHNLKATKNGYMEKWIVFFRRWSRNLEMDTWRSGRFWFYCILNFRA